MCISNWHVKVAFRVCIANRISDRRGNLEIGTPDCQGNFGIAFQTIFQTAPAILEWTFQIARPFFGIDISEYQCKFAINNSEWRFCIGIFSGGDWFPKSGGTIWAWAGEPVPRARPTKYSTASKNHSLGKCAFQMCMSNLHFKIKIQIDISNWHSVFAFQVFI